MRCCRSAWPRSSAPGPYFIGLLGQRYGWVPDEIPATLVDELGWLVDARDRSVTEMEILHGVLNDPEAAGHAYFYLRDPAWVAALPADEQATYVEDSEEGRAKLEELKDRVRASGHPVRDYPDPVGLGEQVLADLVALVERLYPDPTPPEPLARDRAEHAAFAASRFAGFVERPALAARLDAHAGGADGAAARHRRVRRRARRRWSPNWAAARAGGPPRRRRDRALRRAPTPRRPTGRRWPTGSSASWPAATA